MRTIVEIPDQNVRALDALCKREHISRAEAIRRAVEAWLKQHQGETDAAFGLWKNRGRDGLSYQDALRNEWDTPTTHEPDKQ